MTFSLALTAFAVAGAVSDAHTARIPNRLVLAGLAAALLLRAGWGLLPLWHGVAGGLIALGVGFPLFALRAFGAGDVKFLAACCAFAGAPLTGRVLLLSAAAGGLVALYVVARRRLPLVAWLRTWNLAKAVLTAGHAGERLTLDDSGAIAAPYGVAIAAGVLLTWFGTAGGWIP